jgi:hypothetical protein
MLDELYNKSAELLFRNINMHNPLVLYNGQSCNSSICSNKVYDSNLKTFKVDVARFSSFEIVEGPYCGDTRCQPDIGEDCSGCSDCYCGTGYSCINKSCRSNDQTNTPGPKPPIKLCATNWNCTWTPCTNNIQTFNCVDKNRCGTISGRPSDNGKTRSCLVNKQCVDNDNDGYGAGKDCLGPDINDNDPAITDTLPSNNVETPDTTGDKIRDFLRDNLYYIVAVLILLALVVAIIIIVIVLVKASKKPASGIQISEKHIKQTTRKFE